MYSSYSLTKHLVSVNIWAILFLLIRSASSLNLTNAYLHHKCLANKGKYNSGSEFEKNLDFLTRRVGADTFANGFTYISYGEAPNLVSIVFQCRGDSYGSICRSCYATAVAGLRRRCQRYKAAIIWYDQCFLDVSTVSPPPERNDYENTISMYNPNNVNGDKESFNKKIKDFLYQLSLEANKPPADISLIFYKTGEKMLGEKKVYAMVQCTQHIFNCKTCLEWSIKELSKCCNGKQGARILGTSCNLRYELYPFIRT